MFAISAFKKVENCEMLNWELEDVSQLHLKYVWNCWKQHLSNSLFSALYSKERNLKIIEKPKFYQYSEEHCEFCEEKIGFWIANFLDFELNTVATVLSTSTKYGSFRRFGLLSTLDGEFWRIHAADSGISEYFSKRNIYHKPGKAGTAMSSWSKKKKPKTHLCC